MLFLLTTLLIKNLHTAFPQASCTWRAARDAERFEESGLEIQAFRVHVFLAGCTGEWHERCDCHLLFTLVLAGGVPHDRWIEILIDWGAGV